MIKVGTKVVGMRNWTSYPEVGQVVYEIPRDIDPLHRFLVNKNPDREIIIPDKESYFQQIEGIIDDVVFVDERTIKEYSKANERKLGKLVKLLDSRLGQEFFDREKNLLDFFSKGKSLFALNLQIVGLFLWSILRGLYRKFILGVFELLFRDIFSFFENRKEIELLRRNLAKKRRSRAIDVEFNSILRLRGVEEDKKLEVEIGEIENRLNKLSGSNDEKSRSFLTFAVAIGGLIIALLQLSLVFNQTSIMQKQADIMVSQTAISSEQTKMQRSQAQPHFEVSQFYGRDPKSQKVVSTNLAITKDANFAQSVAVGQFTLLSTKTHRMDDSKPLVQFGVFNFFDRLSITDPTSSRWTLSSADNLEVVKANNKLLEGRTYQNEVVEPLTTRNYVSISYVDQFDTPHTDYFLVDDLGSRKITSAEGEAARKIFEEKGTGGMGEGLTRALSNWIKKNCD